MKAKHCCLFTMTAALLLAGCTAVDEQAWLEGGNVPVQLTVSQDVSGDITRTTSDLHSAATGFVAGETMTVFMKDGSTTTNKTYKVVTGGAQSTLGPNTANDPLYYPTGTSGSVDLYAVYPSTITYGGTHTVAYDQTDNDKYKNSDLMYSPVTTVNLSAKGSQQSLSNFQHKMVRLKLNVVKSSDITSITEIKMNNVKRKVTVSALDENGITISTAETATGETETGANSDEILIFSGTNNSTSQVTYYVVFPKQQASGTNDWDDDDFLTVTAEGAVATYTLTKEFIVGKQYELTLNINKAALNNTVAITGWTDTDPQAVNPTVETKLEAVDLGLSVKWANMNVGANSETDYGDYFMWGDVAGYGGAASSGTAADGISFSWANYKYCNGAYNKLTKYCSYSTFGNDGFTDALTTLESSDDAARTHLGGSWRMPTAVELAELWRTNPDYDPDDDEISTTKTKIGGYTWTWCDGSTEKYKNTTAVGYKITRNSTGATIFLPAAGYRGSTDVEDQGLHGDYWSSTLGTDPDNTWYLYFFSGVAGMSYYGLRFNGYPVRAVYDPSFPGALSGKFTINADGDKVYFSKGNLQATYDGSSWTWSFAEHQWDYIGGRSDGGSEAQTGNNYINGNGTVSQNCTVDLFSWVGASSTWTGVAQYGITSTGWSAINNTDGYGTPEDENLKSDWGTLAISNGGNTANSGWRTLTGCESNWWISEWCFLFNYRTTTSGARYAMAVVNGVNGVILLPDDWSTSYYTLNNTNPNPLVIFSYTDNIITSDEWINDFEAHGAVFLPAAGSRDEEDELHVVFGAGSQGIYWASNSGINDEHAWYGSPGVFFDPSSYVFFTRDGGILRCNGCSVRLVRQVE